MKLSHDRKFTVKWLVIILLNLFMTYQPGARGEAITATSTPKTKTEIEFEKKLNIAAASNKTMRGEDIRRGGAGMILDGVCSREETLLPIVQSNSVSENEYLRKSHDPT